MLALSPLGILENDADVVVVDGKFLLEDPDMDIIHEFYDGNYDLLDSIDFEDIFNGDVLPDLDPEDILVPELYVSGEENNKNNHSSAASNDDDGGDGNCGRMSASDSSSVCGSKDGGIAARKKADKRRKSSSKNNRSKNSPHQEGKRKVKVDWTPELHKRFVEAVEKLGVDKAVPSRILEVMGTCSLTRHNIASHLQKYRSHQKHLLAREAEAASWNQRRRMYATPHLGSMRDATALAPWAAAPAMGIPSVSPPQHHYRPLHVWGLPTMNGPVLRPWPNPNHVPNPPPLPMAWAATPLSPPPLSPSYWAHPQHHLATIAPTLPARFFAQPAGESTKGFFPPPVPGVPPPTMFEADHRTGDTPLPPEFHPSNETIDASIEEVLSNRTLPLPLGLKPPSMDGVIGELQRQGLTKIPPSSSSSSLVADNHQSLASTTIV